MAMAGPGWAGLVAPAREIFRFPMFISLGNAGKNFREAISAGTLELPVEFDFRMTVHFDRAVGGGRAPLSSSDRQRILDEAFMPEYAPDVSRVVLLAGLSGATGGELVAPVARRYQLAGFDVRAVVSLPFLFEGQGARRRADRQLASLRETGSAVAVIDNAAEIARLPGSLTLKQAFQSMNRLAAEQAASLAWSVGPTQAQV